jgi:hypothetical protein
VFWQALRIRGARRVAIEDPGWRWQRYTVEHAGLEAGPGAGGLRRPGRHRSRCRRRGYGGDDPATSKPARIRRSARIRQPDGPAHVSRFVMGLGSGEWLPPARH